MDLLQSKKKQKEYYDKSTRSLKPLKPNDMRKFFGCGFYFGLVNIISSDQFSGSVQGEKSFASFVHTPAGIDLCTDQIAGSSLDSDGFLRGSIFFPSSLHLPICSNHLMDPVYGNVWRALILLSLWRGSEQLQVCIDRKQAISGPCNVQLICSDLSGDSNLEWFRGNEKVVNDQRHNLQFGGSILNVTLDSHLAQTVYKCKGAQADAKLIVDVGETCGYSDYVKMLPDISSIQYQKVKIILTAIYLAICVAALLITFYLCRDQSSNSGKKSKQNKDDEGIYSDLLSPGLHPSTEEQSQALATGQRVQAEPRGSSNLTVEAEAETSSGQRQQAMTGLSSGSISKPAEARPAASLRGQAEAGPTSLRRQAEAGPSSGSIREHAEAGIASPQLVPVQDSTYTSLKQRPKDSDYQHLSPQGTDGQSAVTYSAEAEQVTL
ncbi:uncharacterized protein [Scyliorhinus torazame]|uniref:uncharacterized protein n=1 Tax=Scyliorhinus torazame TaxID=75743 RepID=UPI003B58EEC7